MVLQMMDIGHTVRGTAKDFGPHESISNRPLGPDQSNYFTNFLGPIVVTPTHSLPHGTPGYSILKNKFIVCW